MTYLGVIGSVLLPKLDYLSCDRRVIPPEHKASDQSVLLVIVRIYRVDDAKLANGRQASRGGRTAGRSFRTLLLVEVSQDNREDVCRLAIGSAADEPAGAVVDQGNADSRARMLSGAECTATRKCA
jgi:hypothetical protein